MPLKPQPLKSPISLLEPNSAANSVGSKDMSEITAKVNLMNFDRPQMEEFFLGIGEKKFRAHQMLRWIYHGGETDFIKMTDFGKVLRQKLDESCDVIAPAEPSRGTLCVSSQIGCALNCSFCSTGAQGFNRNLSTAEIIGQVWQAAQRLKHDSQNRRLTNVVMMGMGEPLLNFDAVLPALNLMRDDLGFGLANKRVTVSTAGLVPGIDELAERCDVSLAVSLHAPNDKLRDELVPLNKKYPIDTLLAACLRFLKGKPRATVTFEYTLIDGVNDQLEHARDLAKLLRDIPSKINLLPFNSFPGTKYKRPSADAIKHFQTLLMRTGYMTTVRRTRGDDIDAACGQLAGRVVDRTRRSAEIKRQNESKNQGAAA
jgi:23S rRNA (adenine2503-C2)-methyltransferase